MSNELKSTILFISSVLLVVGCFNVPYSYYNFLRLTTTLTALYTIYLFKNDTLFRVLFILVATLYNPVLPVYINSKMFWIYSDVFLAGLLFERSVYLFQKK